MFNFKKQHKSVETKLYNKILLLSRNKIFYSKFNFEDSFQNRIHLIFLHMIFLINKINNDTKNENHKKLSQRLFDFTFRSIEANMREIGYGDVSVNKNMKLLVKSFYNILLDSKNYKNKNIGDKNNFFYKYFYIEEIHKNSKNTELIEYFDKYQAFCLDLCLDTVLKGDLNFNY